MITIIDAGKTDTTEIDWHQFFRLVGCNINRTDQVKELPSPIHLSITILFLNHESMNLIYLWHGMVSVPEPSMMDDGERSREYMAGKHYPS